MPFAPEIAIAATVLGAAVSAAGAMEQASATQNQMNYQSQVANINRQIDYQQSQREIALGEEKAQQAGMKTRSELGGIIAEQGAGGLDVRSGTNLLVQDSAERLGQFNEAIVRNDASRRSYDYLVKGFSDEASQNLYAFGAQQAPVAGAFQAGGALTGLSSAATKYYQFSTPGQQVATV
jgi:hypothetical protein